MKCSSFLPCRNPAGSRGWRADRRGPRGSSLPTCPMAGCSLLIPFHYPAPFNAGLQSHQKPLNSASFGSVPSLPPQGPVQPSSSSSLPLVCLTPQSIQRAAGEDRTQPGAPSALRRQSQDLQLRLRSPKVLPEIKHQEPPQISSNKGRNAVSVCGLGGNKGSL